jgi:hypothetical protein
MSILRIQRACAHRVLGLVLTAALGFTAACEDSDDDPGESSSDQGTAGRDSSAGGKGSAGKGGSSGGKAGSGGKGSDNNGSGDGQGGQSGSKAGSGGSGGAAAGGNDADAGADDSDAGSDGLPQAFKITFGTTECFGTCPVYTVSLDQAGAVKFNGEMHVAKTGESEKTVSAAAAAEVYETLLAADYFELNDEYRDEADGCERIRTDSPTHNWSVEHDGQTKKLSHYLGCEGVPALENIYNISELLVEKTEILEWIGTGN